MNSLYINLAELLEILEELDRFPDTWYYYNQIEAELNHIESGGSVEIQYVAELVTSILQVVVRCKGDVHKTKTVVANIADVLYSVSE